MQTNANGKSPTKVRLRPIALPSEHGGWGMLGAPILTGLLVSPSWSGGLIGVAAASAFLTRQPFRLALTDIRKGKRYPRTAWAIRFASFYGLFGLAALVAATVLAKQPFWPPLLLAAALGTLQFSFDIEAKGRSFLPEASGAGAMALIAAAILQAAGYPVARSWLPVCALVLQSGTAISYAAARVRLARDVKVVRWPVWAGHAAATLIVLGLVQVGWMKWPVVAAFLVLTMRASWGLSAYRRNVKAGWVGLQEVGYALMAVGCIVLSMR